MPLTRLGWVLSISSAPLGCRHSDISLSNRLVRLVKFLRSNFDPLDEWTYCTWDRKYSYENSQLRVYYVLKGQHVFVHMTQWSGIAWGGVNRSRATGGEAGLLAAAPSKCGTCVYGCEGSRFTANIQFSPSAQKYCGANIQKSPSESSRGESDTIKSVRSLRQNRVYPTGATK